MLVCCAQQSPEEKKAEQDRIMREQEAMMLAKYGKGCNVYASFAAFLMRALYPVSLCVVAPLFSSLPSGGMKPKKKGGAALPKVCAV